MKTPNIAGIVQGYTYLLNIVGIVWGLIYLVVGVASSFTIGSNDSWSSIALLFLVFLLPLPITVVAVWFPKATGIALIVSAAFSVVILSFLSGIKETMTASPGIRLFIPHFVFAVAYILAGWTTKTSQAGRP